MCEHIRISKPVYRMTKLSARAESWGFYALSSFIIMTANYRTCYARLKYLRRHKAWKQFQLQECPSSSRQNSSGRLCTPHFNFMAIEVWRLLTSVFWQPLLCSNLLLSNPKIIFYPSSVVTPRESWSKAHNKCGEEVLKIFNLIIRKSKWVDKPNGFFGKKH